MFRLAIGSIPALGSSRNIIYGLASKLIAVHNFHLFPPERFSASLSLYYSISNLLKI